MAIPRGDPTWSHAKSYTRATPGNTQNAGISANWTGGRSECSDHQLDRDQQRQAGEDQLESALGDRIGDNHTDTDSHRGERADHQPLPDPDVPVAELAPDGDGSDRHDRKQRGGLGPNL